MLSVRPIIAVSMLVHRTTCLIRTGRSFQAIDKILNRSCDFEHRYSLMFARVSVECLLATAEHIKKRYAGVSRNNFIVPLHQKSNLSRYFVVFSGLALWGFSENVRLSEVTTTPPIEACSSDGVLTAWCAYKNAEGLVVTPDGRF